MLDSERKSAWVLAASIALVGALIFSLRHSSQTKPLEDDRSDSPAQNRQSIPSVSESHKSDAQETTRNNSKRRFFIRIPLVFVILLRRKRGYYRMRWDFVALFTGILAFVGVIQYCVLRNTDMTLSNTLDVAKTSQRPYLSLKQTLDMSHDVSVDFRGAIEFYVTWLNSGTIPTKAEFASTGGGDLSYKWGRSDDYRNGSWVFGPKGELRHRAFVQFPNDIRNMVAAGSQFRIMEWVRYPDSLFEGKIRQTRVCIYIYNIALFDNDTKLKGTPFPCTESGTNCVDDDCPPLEWPDENPARPDKLRGPK
jgi:hypothetical protein